jgi:primosomal protein N' (replication factor Y)
MLIAEIYPIQRMPRKFSAFDYLVPEGLKLERGFFVQIPLRNQQVLGIVKEIHERFSPRQNLKTVIGISSLPKLSEVELKNFEWLAKDLAQSIPSILNAAIPTPAKRPSAVSKVVPLTLKIRTSEVPAIQRSLQAIEERRMAFISVSDITRMTAVVAAYLHAHPKDQVTVLVPGLREIEALAPFLTGFGLSIVSGEESEGRRFTAWNNFRARQTRVLLGSRVASLLLSAATDVVFVFHSGHENHKQRDRNPRYDARDIVLGFQRQTDCRLYFFDSAPRADDFVLFKPEQIYLEHPEPRPIFVNLNDERPMSEHPLISWTLDGAINDCLKSGRRVLCFYNRKGKASSLRCADCGQGFPCPACAGVFTVYETSIRCHHCGRAEPIPLLCPKCGGIRLVEKGFGNQTIKQALLKQFPETTVSLIDQAIQEDDSAQILLVTSYYLETYRQFFSRGNFGLVVNLDADLPLLDPGFRSFENALRIVEDLRGLATRESAVFVAQTRSPEIFSAYYDNPEACLKKELELRRSYEVPPFVRWVSLKIRDPEELRVELELKTAAEIFRSLPGVTVFPIKYEHGKGCSISLSVEPNSMPVVLEKLSELPDRVIIDTNAVS